MQFDYYKIHDKEYALFDVRGWVLKRYPEYRHSLRIMKERYSGFTGRIYSMIYLAVTICRYQFTFTLTWDNKSLTPEDAYKRLQEHHKQNREKDI